MGRPASRTRFRPAAVRLWEDPDAVVAAVTDFLGAT
jgi:hypothetical protein